MAQPRAHQLPNGKWVGTATSPTGKRLTKVYNREGEALIWAETEMLRMERQLNRPSSGQPASVAVVELAEARDFRYYAHRWLTLKPTEDRSRRSQVNGLVEEFGTSRLTDITRLDVQRYMTRLARGDGDQAKLAVSTIHRRAKILRAIIAAAIADPKVPITDNPCDGVELPDAVESPFHIVDAEEEERLLAACVDDRDRLALLLSLYAGLRWGEVFGLQRHRLNPLLGMELTVASTAVRGGEMPQPYTKSKTVRHLGRVPAKLRVALESYLVTTDIPKCGVLLPTRHGRCISYSNWRRLRLEPMLERAGLSGVLTFHDLRHTYATRLASVGVPVGEIMELLGHTKVETTMIYLHAAAPNVRDAWVRYAFDGGVSPVVPASAAVAL